jgi:hypothetical protein
MLPVIFSEKHCTESVVSILAETPPLIGELDLIIPASCLSVKTRLLATMRCLIPGKKFVLAIMFPFLWGLDMDYGA